MAHKDLLSGSYATLLSTDTEAELWVVQLIPLLKEVDLAQLRARTPEPQGLVQVQDGNARKVGDAGHGLQDPEFLCTAYTHLDWAVDVYHIQDQAQRIKGQLDKQRGVELPVALVALLLHAGHRIIVQGKARQLFLDLMDTRGVHKIVGEVVQWLACRDGLGVWMTVMLPRVRRDSSLGSVREKGCA
eukprot:1149234-Pelagomonas_calceolata.AAC.7